MDYDLIVIGAGPGGYIAAIRAAQLGLSVACIDEWSRDDGAPAPGGTCTNVGCIPSKAMLQSSEHYEHVGHGMVEHGIDVGSVKLDLSRMLARKQQVVRQNNDGILYLFKKNKVKFVHGHAAFAGRSDAGFEVAVQGAEPATLRARQVIVATGSRPRALPGLPFDEQRVLSNTGALALPKVPQRMGIIGAGVIGLEMGSVWRRLGAKVTVLEALPDFLGAADTQVAKEALKQFTRQGLDIQLGVNISEVKPPAKSGPVRLRYTDAKGGEQQLEVDALMVSIGRVPHTDALQLDKVGLKLDERGFIPVDADCRSEVPGIWAIGDVVRGPMLAHKAEEEGVAVAERLAGQKPHVDFNTVPWVIYTSPEIAWVGQTEQALKAAGRAYRSGSFPFMANGRARALGDTTGFVKMLSDAATDEILGVHVIGPMASELISEAAVAMEFKASAEDIARICHAHPTLSEAMKEAALATDSRALNF